MATGVLVVAVGPATKLIQFAQEMPKTYVGEFRLGFSSNTEDASGDVVALENTPQPSEHELRKAVESFHGDVTQTPPQFSAVKVNGQRAYKVARGGGTVEIAPRSITVHSIMLVTLDYPNFTIQVECSKGTYIRTLGRDIAKSLGSDAIMTSLKRTRIGRFAIETSQSPDQLDTNSISQSLRPPAEMVSHLKRMTLSNVELQMLAHGKRLDGNQWTEEIRASPRLAAFSNGGQLVAVIDKKSDTEFGSVVNFAPLLT